ncbi:MAG: hypothetical protein MZU97_00910 [Bacillus subtilis]|nr:hypothetical protein [Bacillus subtilis]
MIAALTGHGRFERIDVRRSDRRRRGDVHGRRRLPRRTNGSSLRRALFPHVQERLEDLCPLQRAHHRLAAT